MKIIDARNRSKYKEGGKVVKNTKIVYGKKNKEGGYTVVVEKPTPTEDNPGDTRLYKHEGSDYGQASANQKFAEAKARAKSVYTPSDSLSRGDFEKLKNQPKEKIKKKKRLFKRKRK